MWTFPTCHHGLGVLNLRGFFFFFLGGGGINFLVQSVQWICTLWLFNIAMENGPFIDYIFLLIPPFIRDFPWQTVSHNQRVNGFHFNGPSLA